MKTQTLENRVDKATRERAKWNPKNVLKDIGYGVGLGTLGAHELPSVYLDRPNIYGFDLSSGPWENMRYSKGTPMYGHDLIKKGISLATTVVELGAYAYFGSKGIPAYWFPVATNALSSVVYLWGKALEFSDHMSGMIQG